jgi:hypothetical protein
MHVWVSCKVLYYTRFAGVHSTVRHGAAHNNHGNRKKEVVCMPRSSLVLLEIFLSGLLLCPVNGETVKCVNEARIYSVPHTGI